MNPEDNVRAVNDASHKAARKIVGLLNFTREEEAAEMFRLASDVVRQTLLEYIRDRQHMLRRLGKLKPSEN